MHALLSAGERAQALEDGVDVTGVGGEVEDGVEVGTAGELRVAADEPAEVQALVPGAHREPLHVAVGLVARGAGGGGGGGGGGGAGGARPPPGGGGRGGGSGGGGARARAGAARTRRARP